MFVLALVTVLAIVVVVEKNSHYEYEHEHRCAGHESASARLETRTLTRRVVAQGAI